MQRLKFTIEISASREQVWGALWRDETFRQWANFVDPGTYMVGELQEGSIVQFNSREGYGVTSLVAKLLPNEYVLFQHRADTKNNGESSRDDQWTGGSESYKLNENGGLTTLEMEFDVPEELVDVMQNSYPRALQCIKGLAEANDSTL